MEIQFLGHSTFIIRFGGKSLLFDPFINPEIIDIPDLSIDFILLSHAHFDHTRDVELILKTNPKAIIISNYEIATFYSNKGYHTHGINHGGKYNFSFGTLKFVNAVHTSSFSDGSYGGNPGGFVIYDDSNCIYFAGDTALTMDMKLIPLTCPPLDFAILPIGDNFTMGYEDAIIACDYIQCNKIVGCHYDTFEIIKINKDKVKESFDTKGLTLYLPAIGEKLEL